MDSRQKTKRQLLAELDRLNRRLARMESRLADFGQTKQELDYLGTHDILTGLCNCVLLREIMARLDRSRQFPITVIVANIDGLKQINYREGYAVGNELLKRAAMVLKEISCPGGVIARIGGDEFVALLPKTNEVSAQAALNKSERMLFSLNATRAGAPLRISFGKATASKVGSLLDTLRTADEHMRQEKTAHRLMGSASAPRNPQLLFKHIEAMMLANPGMHLCRLASELSCERHRIERAVKEETSMPFREYRQVTLLAVALRLLREKPLLIKEVSSALGYGSPRSLWRLLKTKLRRNPTTVRASTFRGPASDARSATSFSTSVSPPLLKSDLCGF